MASVCPEELHQRLDLLYSVWAAPVCVRSAGAPSCVCAPQPKRETLGNSGDCRCNVQIQAWAICFKINPRIAGGIRTVSPEAAILIGTN